MLAFSLPVEKNFGNLPLVIGEATEIWLHTLFVLSLTRYADGHSLQKKI
jgi:hypothetical protein